MRYDALVSEPQLNVAYVALGSNLGNRAANIAEALSRLEQGGAVHVERVSSHFDNPAVGGPRGFPAVS